MDGWMDGRPSLETSFFRDALGAASIGASRDRGGVVKWMIAGRQIVRDRRTRPLVRDRRRRQAVKRDL